MTNRLSGKSGFMLIIVTIVALALTTLLGVLALNVQYNSQAISRYISGVKAYYLAVTGVAYIRSNYYLDWAESVYPNKAVTSDKIELPGYGGSVNVTRTPSFLNSKIVSAATFNGVTKKITCEAGDNDVPLELSTGMFSACSGENYFYWSFGASHNWISNYIYESELPITKWDTGTKN